MAEVGLVALALHEAGGLVDVPGALGFVGLRTDVGAEGHARVLEQGGEIDGAMRMYRAVEQSAPAANGWLTERETVLEALLAMRRAGACAILTYFALDAARWLADG